MSAQVYWSDDYFYVTNDQIATGPENYSPANIGSVHVIEKPTSRFYRLWQRIVLAWAGVFVLLLLPAYFSHSAPDEITLCLGSSASVLAWVNLAASSIMLKRGRYPEYRLIIRDRLGQSSILLRTRDEHYARHVADAIRITARHGRHM